MKIRIHSLVMLALAVTLVGCATTQSLYRPPEGTLGSLALLKTSEQPLVIFMVDGLPTMTQMQWAFYKYPPQVVVTPAKHTVRVMYVMHSASSRMDLWFIAEKGAHYILKQETANSKLRFWIEDFATGKEVGGIVGSDDEPSR